MASALALSLPSNGSGDMADVWPRLKRSAAQMTTSEDIFELASDAFSAKRFAGHGAFEAAFRSAVPDQLASGIHFTDTGFATSDQQTDQIVVTATMARAFEEGYEQAYCEKMPLWASARETIHDGQKSVHTLASPPVINYLLHLKALTKRFRGFGQRNDLGSALERLTTRYDEFTAETAEGAAATWSLLGNMVSGVDSSAYANSTAARMARGPTERLIGTSLIERSSVFNLFDTDVRVGDAVFWAFREIDLDWTRSLLDPNGSPVVAHDGQPTLQLVGFSTRGRGYIPRDASLAKSGLSDLGYTRRVSRVVSAARALNIADEQDVAGALESVPTIMYDEYMTGAVTAAGIVRNIYGRASGKAAIQLGLRSHEAMKSLPYLELYTSLY